MRFEMKYWFRFPLYSNEYSIYIQGNHLILDGVKRICHDNKFKMKMVDWNYFQIYREFHTPNVISNFANTLFNPVLQDVLKNIVNLIYEVNKFYSSKERIEG